MGNDDEAMTQADVNGAITSYLEDGDTEPWLRVLRAIADGRVIAKAQVGTLVLVANTAPVRRQFGRRLSALLARSNMTQAQLAELLGVSPSAVIRLLNGTVVSPWPSVTMIVTALGDDPADYKEEWLAAKTEQVRLRID